MCRRAIEGQTAGISWVMKWGVDGERKGGFGIRLGTFVSIGVAMSRVRYVN